MCTKPQDVVLEVKELSDREIYSIKSFREVADTFSKEDVANINAAEFYSNSTGRYKICSSDSELVAFVEGKACKEGSFFACSSREALSYLGSLMSLKKMAYNANF